MSARAKKRVVSTQAMRAFADRSQWRAWLAKHHLSGTEIWLRFFKKHTGRPSVSYVEAVEEALCFGWIDSIIRRVDDATYAQKFTPRRIDSKWSELNKTRLRKLIHEGRMTQAGLAKAPAVAPEVDSAPPSDTDAVARRMERKLALHDRAWRNFQALTPARRRAYLRLITEARTEETREKRLQEVIALLEHGSGQSSDTPAFITRALRANRKAWEYFNGLAPSHRRQYVGWIMLAKRPETRERRLREAVTRLAQNRTLGLK